MRLTRRLAELERVTHKFAGYASIDVFDGQTIEQAQAEWVSSNGPIGDRQIVLWNMGGLLDAPA